MKCVIDRKELTQVLKRLKPLFSQRSVLGVLTSIHAEVKGERLLLTSTDLQSTLQFTLKVENAKEGVLLLPGKELLGLASKGRGDQVEIRAKGEEGLKVHLKVGGVSATLSALPFSAYPKIPKWNEDLSPIPTCTLIEILGKTSYAISLDAGRPALGGVFLKTLDRKLTSAATDGHRAAMYQSTWVPPESPQLKEGVTLHHAGVALALSALNPKEEVSLGFVTTGARTKVQIESLMWRLDFSIIDGNFPDVWNVLPRRLPGALVNRKDLVDAIKSIMPLSSPLMAVGITVHEGDHLQLLAAKRGDKGAAGHAMARIGTLMKREDDEGINTGLKAAYLLDALNCVDGDEVEIDFRDCTTPVQITDPERDDILHIVMPMGGAPVQIEEDNDESS